MALPFDPFAVTKWATNSSGHAVGKNDDEDDDDDDVWKEESKSFSLSSFRTVKHITWIELLCVKESDSITKSDCTKADTFNSIIIQ